MNGSILIVDSLLIISLLWAPIAQLDKATNRQLAINRFGSEVTPCRMLVDSAVRRLLLNITEQTAGLATNEQALTKCSRHIEFSLSNGLEL